MGTESSMAHPSDPTLAQRRVLEDARRRLIALASDLRPETASEAALLTAAAAIDTVAHRVRWVADVTEHEEGP